MDTPQPSTTVVVLAGLGIGLLGIYYGMNTPSRGPKKPPKRAENTVYIHVTKPNKLFGLFSPNIWGLKLETWLRLAKIPHEVIRTETAARYSPDGTLPFIEYNGDYVAQPHEIVQYLMATTKVNPDSSLTPAQRATGYIVDRLVEHSLANLLVTYARRTHPLVVERDLQRYFPIHWMPDVLTSPLVAFVVHRRKASWGLTEEKRRQLVKSDMAALSDILGNNDFITGASRPSTVDATVFALLVCATEASIKDDEMARWLGTLNGGNLTRYIGKMKSTIWSDWWSNQERLQYRAGS